MTVSPMANANAPVHVARGARLQSRGSGGLVRLLNAPVHSHVFRQPPRDFSD